MFVNNGDINLVQYDSIHEFMDILTRPGLSGRDDSSQEYDHGGRWAGTETYEESFELLKYGDREGLDHMKDLKFVTDKVFNINMSDRVRSKNDVVGYHANVPNAIMGLPNSMINVKRQPAPNKVLDILVNYSWGGMTDKEIISNVGVSVLSAIDYLERKGFRINLYVGKINTIPGGKSSGFIVRIKNANQPLNLLKVSYYLTNPAFLRRTAFKINEAEDRLIDCTHAGYGRADNFEQHTRNIHKYVNKDLIVMDKTLDIYDDDSPQEIADKIKNKLVKRGLHLS